MKFISLRRTCFFFLYGEKMLGEMLSEIGREEERRGVERRGRKGRGK